MVDAMVDAMVHAVVECGPIWKIFGERAATQPVPVPGNAAGTPGHWALGGQSLEPFAPHGADLRNYGRETGIGHVWLTSGTKSVHIFLPTDTEVVC